MELTPQGILGWIDRVGESYGESHDFVIIPESGIREIKAQLALSQVCPDCEGEGEIDAISNDGFGYTYDIRTRCPACQGKVKKPDREKIAKALREMKFDTTTLIDFGARLTEHDIHQIIALLEEK